jgi:hypothetical protein
MNKPSIHTVPGPTCFAAARCIACAALLVAVSGLASPASTFGQVNELRRGSAVSGQSTDTHGTSLQSFLVGNPKATSQTLSESDASGGVDEAGSVSALPELDLSRFARRAAWSLVAVLSACIAGLLLIKRFRLERIFPGKRKTVDTTPRNIRVEATLKLGGNRILEIVQGEHGRIAVVSDGKGIHAVTLSEKSFREELDASRSKHPADAGPANGKKEKRTGDEAADPVRNTFRHWQLLPGTGIPGSGH